MSNVARVKLLPAHSCASARSRKGKRKSAPTGESQEELLGMVEDLKQHQAEVMDKLEAAAAKAAAPAPASAPTSGKRKAKRQRDRSPPLPPTSSRSMKTGKAQKHEHDSALGSSRQSLQGLKRGQKSEVVFSVQYKARNEYNWDDVCALGERIERGEVRLNWCNKKDENGNPLYRVGKTAMLRWTMDDDEAMRRAGKGRGVKGVPHWRAERDVRRRTELPKPGGVKGGGTVLGAAEAALCVKFARAAEVSTTPRRAATLPRRARSSPPPPTPPGRLGASDTPSHQPTFTAPVPPPTHPHPPTLPCLLSPHSQNGTAYLEDEVKQLLLDTAIELGLSNPSTKKPYTQGSNIDKLASNFLRRCHDDGVPLVPKDNMMALAKIRADSATHDKLMAFRDQVVRHPVDGLIAFQKRHGVKLTLNQVCNFDEVSQRGVGVWGGGCGGFCVVMCSPSAPTHLLTPPPHPTP